MVRFSKYLPFWYRSTFVIPILVFLSIVLLSIMVRASEPDDRASRLAKEFIDFNRELNALEQRVLYPEVNRLAIFLQFGLSEAYVLESLQITLDGKFLTSYVYDSGELSGLRNGGIQRLYQGLLENGKHSLSVSFNVRGDNEVYLRREKQIRFDHDGKAGITLHISVTQDRNTRQPLFSLEKR